MTLNQLVLRYVVSIGSVVVRWRFPAKLFVPAARSN